MESAIPGRITKKTSDTNVKKIILCPLRTKDNQGFAHSFPAEGLEGYKIPGSAGLTNERFNL
jgi:hypothetical protein